EELVSRVLWIGQLAQLRPQRLGLSVVKDRNIRDVPVLLEERDLVGGELVSPVLVAAYGPGEQGRDRHVARSEIADHLNQPPPRPGAAGPLRPQMLRQERNAPLAPERVLAGEDLLLDSIGRP